MSNEWAKGLSEETICKIINVGDGHSLVSPTDYLEVGAPEEVIDRHTVVHKSERVPKYKAVDFVAEKLEELVEQWGDMLTEESDRKYCCESIAKDLLQSLVDSEHREIWAYHPKACIFVNGEIVEELEAVNSLRLVQELVSSLGVEGVKQSMGRGFQYENYRKAVRKHFGPIDSE